jgi:hypothetical protein
MSHGLRPVGRWASLSEDRFCPYPVKNNWRRRGDCVSHFSMYDSGQSPTKDKQEFYALDLMKLTYCWTKWNIYRFDISHGHLKISQGRSPHDCGLARNGYDSTLRVIDRADTAMTIRCLSSMWHINPMSMSAQIKHYIRNIKRIDWVRAHVNRKPCKQSSIFEPTRHPQLNSFNLGR